jgi:hypothetical protein
MLYEQGLGGAVQRPVSSPPTLVSPNAGLGNVTIQTGSNGVRNFSWNVASPAPPVPKPAPLAAKLAQLKHEKFSSRDRTERIAKSLAAIAAVQPSTLTAAEWKQIVESEIEDQY